MTDLKLPILYSFRRCPYAMRARMAIKAAGIECELREIKLQDKPAEMLALSAKGTVPVLRLSSDEVIDESLEIMLWALNKADPLSWLEVDKKKLDLILERNDVEFKEKLDRYKYHVRHPGQSREYYRSEAEPFLLELEEAIKNNEGLGILEQRITIADIAVFPFIRQFTRVDLDWFATSRYEYLKAWVEKFENNPVFKGVMKKYSLWQTSKQGHAFP